MNIYVKNLNFSLSEQTLKETFERFGKVDSAKIIKDRETGRSKGFGFVEMADTEEAEAAIEELNGAEIAGRTVYVDKAKDKK